MTEAKIYIVETPVKDFCGVGAAGVNFAYGKAEVADGWVLNWFKEHGYIVTEKNPENSFEKMKVEDLKAFAESNGIDLGEAKTKAEIIAVLKNQQ